MKIHPLLKPLHVVYLAYMALAFLGFLVTSTIYSSLALLILRKKAHRPMMWFYKNWARLFFLVGFIRIKVEGKEHLKNAIPCIIVGNHGTNLDMFIGAYCMPLHIKPLAKMELKKMPLLGFLFSTVCVLVDRKSKESREKSSRLLIKEIQHNNSIYIYPEGTRNKGNEPVNKFYDGAFRFAIDAKTKIVAMCTIGGRNLNPSHNYMLKPGTIKVKFLPVYETAGLLLNDVETLKERVWNDMYQTIAHEDPMFAHAKN